MSSATRTARIEMNSDGIVIVRILPEVNQSVEDAKENISAASRLAGKKCPILTDIRDAKPLESETRHYYTGKQLTDYFTAIGVLIKGSPFGRMMGNIYLNVAKPGIPARLFFEENKALAWLKAHQE